ncbi:MAG: hypothetical protein K8T25_10530 [Planctomycetia bacterium]|nr:hypothetical protein [Planctomycetia bacterium]
MTNAQVPQCRNSFRWFTWIVVILFLAYFLFMNLKGTHRPDQVTGNIDTMSPWTHGFPWAFMKRDSHIPPYRSGQSIPIPIPGKSTSNFPFDGTNILEFNPFNLVLNAILGLLTIFSTAVVIECRVRRPHPFQFGLKSIFTLMTGAAVILGLLRVRVIELESLFNVPLLIGLACTVWIGVLGIRRLMAFAGRKPTDQQGQGSAEVRSETDC